MEIGMVLFIGSLVVTCLGLLRLLAGQVVEFDHFAYVEELDDLRERASLRDEYMTHPNCRCVLVPVLTRPGGDMSRDEWRGIMQRRIIREKWFYSPN